MDQVASRRAITARYGALHRPTPRCTGGVSGRGGVVDPVIHGDCATVCPAGRSPLFHYTSLRRWAQARAIMLAAAAMTAPPSIASPPARTTLPARRTAKANASALADRAASAIERVARLTAFPTYAARSAAAFWSRRNASSSGMVADRASTTLRRRRPSCRHPGHRFSNCEPAIRGRHLGFAEASLRLVFGFQRRHLAGVRGEGEVGHRHDLVRGEARLKVASRQPCRCGDREAARVGLCSLLPRTSR